MKTGSASWIKRGTYLENSKALEQRVDFVELLVYTWNTAIKQLLFGELPELKKLDLEYTVHLPLDGIRNCSDAYNFFKDNNFPAKSFTLHPNRGWEYFIADKPDVILENLIDICEPYERICLDIGHLMLSKKEDYLLNHPSLKIIREFHIHGVVNGVDHCVLNSSTIKYVNSLAEKYPVVRKALSNKNTRMNFEIFDLKRLLLSLKRIKNAEFSGN